MENILRQITSLDKYTNNLNWINWFIGFFDSEGNFKTFLTKLNYKTLKLNYKTLTGKSNYYKIGYGFHLSLSIRKYKRSITFV
jgi:hypothetical protein